MFVIFRVDDKKYYDASKPIWVDELSKATKYKTEKTAENTIKTTQLLVAMVNIITILPENHTITPETSFKTLGEPIPEYTKEEAEKAYEELRQAALVFGAAAEKIPAIMHYYEKVQSEQTKLQEDLLHKFEFTSPNNILFVKFGRMLKTCRIKRREAKDRLGYMIAMKDTQAIQVLARHKAHENMIATRNYSPRIATELFQ